MGAKLTLNMMAVERARRGMRQRGLLPCGLPRELLLVLPSMGWKRAQRAEDTSGTKVAL